jgi:tetratricopeptide (TPR) repeat protein
LYDLDADPEERTNLAAARPQTAAELLAQLEGILHRAGAAQQTARATMSQDDLARLEALGYVSATVEGADFDLDAQRELEDPKDLLPFHLETQEVSRLLATGKLDEATVTLEQLLEQRPGYTWAHRQLGAIALKRADPGAAIVHFERALALDPGLVVLRADLARLLLAQGRTEEALAHFRRAADARPMTRCCSATSGSRWPLMAATRRPSTATAQRVTLASNPRSSVASSGGAWRGSASSTPPSRSIDLPCSSIPPAPKATSGSAPR